MTSVVLAGESGAVTEIIEIGPVHHVRKRAWAGLDRLANPCTQAGLEVTALPYGPIPPDLATPDVWILSDLPFGAAAEFGILERIMADVPVRSGLVMIGGAYSYSGIHALGGWQDPRCAALLPVAPPPTADDTERPDGVRLVASEDCPQSLVSLLHEAPAFFGYNRLEPRAGSRVLSWFDDGAPAIVVSDPGPCRTVAFASDLLPHWGAASVQWGRLPDFLAALCAIAAGAAQ